MVQVLVDFFRFAVLAEHTAEDPHAALPDQLERQARVGGTPALTRPGVPSLPALTATEMHHRRRKGGRGGQTLLHAPYLTATFTLGIS